MKLKKVIFYLCVLLAASIVIWFFYTYSGKISRILSPFFITIPLVYVVKPIAVKLSSKKMPIGFAIILVYLFFILFFAAACIFFIPELMTNFRELLNTLPDFVASYEKTINNILSSIKSSKWSEDVKIMVFQQITNGSAALQRFLVKIFENTLNTLVGTVQVVIDLTVAMVIAYYVIKDADTFRDYTLAFLPKGWRRGVTNIGKEINGILAGFIQGQLLTAFIVGIMETAGLMLVKMKYPLVLGMVGGLANIIPYFGPYIGAIPALAVALTISPLKALWSVVVFAVVQQIDNSFISPKVIEGKLGLHPVATIFAVLAGGEFCGILGMLLAVPVMAILRVLINKMVEAVA